MKSIAHYRELKNMTQQELGEAIGVKQSEISSYESGVKSPRLNVLQAMAEALGVTVYQLIEEK